MSKDIVLIPGALASQKFWCNQTSFLQERNSLHYLDIRNDHAITNIAEKFSKTAPSKFTLIAFSMGGYVALDLFNYIPQQIEKLILINSAAKPLSAEGMKDRQRSLTLIKNGKFDLLINLIFKNSIYDKNKYHDLLPLLKSMAQEIGAENYAHQLNAILNKPDHSALLSTIKCPTLLIGSKQDKIMPIERSEHMANNIKDSQLVYLDRCGHAAPLEQPNILNQILSDWLKFTE